MAPGSDLTRRQQQQQQQQRRRQQLLHSTSEVSTLVQRLTQGGLWNHNSSSASSNASSDPPSSSILSTTEEAMRLLSAKVAPSTALGKADRRDTRALCLLEMILRKPPQTKNNTDNSNNINTSSTTPPINLKQAAKILGVKFKDLQALHGIVANYYFEIYDRSSQAQQRQRQRQQQQRTSTQSSASSSLLRGVKRPFPQSQSQQQQKQSTTTSTARSSRPRRTLHVQDLLDDTIHQNNNPNASSNTSSSSILPTMVIRLAMYLRDPASTLRQTQQALQAFVHHVSSPHSTKSVTERRGNEYDLRRYWPAYQAAMLYCIVVVSNQQQTTLQQTKTSSSVGNSKKTTKRPKNAASNTTTKTTATVSNKNNHPDFDEETALALTVERVCHASSAFTFLEIKEKIPFVQKWLLEEYPNDRQQTEPTDGLAVLSSKNDRSKTNTAKGHSKARKSEDHEHSMPEYCHYQNDEDARKAHLEWEQSILDAAIHAVRPEHAQEEEERSNEWDRATCLEKAALKVLAKYNLTVSS